MKKCVAKTAGVIFTKFIMIIFKVAVATQASLTYPVHPWVKALLSTL
jgi:hypothetical protein